MIQSIISHSSVLHSPTPIVGPSPTTNPVAGLSQSIFLVIHSGCGDSGHPINTSNSHRSHVSVT